VSNSSKSNDTWRLQLHSSCLNIFIVSQPQLYPTSHAVFSLIIHREKISQSDERIKQILNSQDLISFTLILFKYNSPRSLKHPAPMDIMHKFCAHGAHKKNGASSFTRSQQLLRRSFACQSRITSTRSASMNRKDISCTHNKYKRNKSEPLLFLLPTSSKIIS